MIPGERRMQGQAITIMIMLMMMMMHVCPTAVRLTTARPVDS
jgi:hypothetical protein